LIGDPDQPAVEKREMAEEKEDGESGEEEGGKKGDE
jgi:hypothetical protein